jgi:tetratricopeptide (TPR) repeat protein
VSAQSDPDTAARVQRLDGLFAVLKTAKDQDEGDVIVADIWKVWLQSGSADMDGRMEQVIKLMAHGLLQHAIEALDEIVAAAPKWAEAWNKRATVLFLMGEYELAGRHRTRSRARAAPFRRAGRHRHDPHGKG